LDFQLVLPLSKDHVDRILNAFGMEVKKGKKYEPGSYNEKFFSNDFRIVPAYDRGRNVLRIILPDSKSRYPENPLCECPFKHQLLFSTNKKVK